MLKLFISAIMFQIFGLHSHHLNSLSENYKELLYKPVSLNRTIREASNCRDTEFLCKSGKCISQYSVCDGIVNCDDGTDETNEECSQWECPEISFQCTYGACVIASAKCNGIYECADKSDEIGCDDQYQKCGKFSFICYNKQCIDSTKICDGRADCNDGSDETKQLCHDFICGDSFQCNYGACVPNDAKCNGIFDCFDGSDENLSECSIGLLEKNTCTLPEKPENGYYKINNASEIRPGSRVPLHTILVFYCNEGYVRLGPELTSCTNKNTWLYNEQPKCVRTCSPKFHFSLETVCTLKDRRVDCSKPAIENTTVRIKCKEYYFYRLSGQRDLEGNSVFRCVNGEWYPSIDFMQCEAECGLKRIDAGIIPLIIHGNDVTDNRKYPWHVGLFKKFTVITKVKWLNMCGGSIIRSNVVLTAAHCTEENNANKYAVGAGKIYKEWKAINDSRDATHIKVKRIIIPDKYAGDSGNYENDIAILILKGHFHFNKFILPICIDWTKKVILTDRTVGTVAGWGLTESGEQSHILKDINLPYISYEKCRASLHFDVKPYLTNDKLCAGRSDGHVLCEGDSGGGYAVQNPNDNLYYLIGIVSVSRSAKINDKNLCDLTMYTLFTHVEYSAHLKFLRENIN